MVQVKKHEVRDSILEVSYDLFARQGYHATSLRQIAKNARISLSNVYVYFRSKYHILFSIYDPWMEEWLERLEQDANAIRDPHERLRYIVTTLWRDIPAARNGFARNIMQALSIAEVNGEYDPHMIQWAEAKLTRLLVSCLPPARQKFAADGSLAHVFMMAFDGFAINQRLNPSAACSDKVVDAICNSILPSFEKASSKKGSSARKNTGAMKKKA